MTTEQTQQFSANVWLHRNHPRHHDPQESAAACLLELSGGIAVVPAREHERMYPRLPLLGLRAFRRSGMRIDIDCGRSFATIRTRRRLWPFA